MPTSQKNPAQPLMKIRDIILTSLIKKYVVRQHDCNFESLKLTWFRIISSQTSVYFVQKEILISPENVVTNFMKRKFFEMTGKPHTVGSSNIQRRMSYTTRSVIYVNRSVVERCLHKTYCCSERVPPKIQ